MTGVLDTNDILVFVFVLQPRDAILKGIVGNIAIGMPHNATTTGTTTHAIGHRATIDDGSGIVGGKRCGGNTSHICRRGGAIDFQGRMAF